MTKKKTPKKPKCDCAFWGLRLCSCHKPAPPPPDDCANCKHNLPNGCEWLKLRVAVRWEGLLLEGEHLRVNPTDGPMVCGEHERAEESEVGK